MQNPLGSVGNLRGKVCCVLHSLPTLTCPSVRT